MAPSASPGPPDDGRVGVYVHVPFCERLCQYCDFAVVAARPLLAARERAYVDALLAELERRAPAFAAAAGGPRSLASLYLGGGTPSLLAPESVARIVAAVRDCFPPAGDVETTLEVNPSTTERARLPGFRAAGVSRLSVSVQSFSDDTLKRLGRAHRGAEARATLAAARAAGFDDVSLDLIVAAPGQRLADLERDLDEALAFAPEHVSAYQLTIEPGTPFERAAARGQLALADEDEGLAMLEPEAPHGARRATVRTLATYLARIAAGAPAAEGEPERLDPATARGEAAFLALRTSEGLDARAFAAEFGAPPRAFWPEAIDEALAAGWLVEGETGALRLTDAGILLSDTLFARLV